MIQLKRLFLSFQYAFEGISYAFAHDQNLRIHMLAAVLVFVGGIILGVSVLELWILGVMVILVFVAEMLNSAIEQMVNLIRLEHSREAKIAKDVSAGMVFFTVAASLIVGLFIFVPRIFHL